MDGLEEIQQYLRQYMAMRAHTQPARPGWRYQSHEEFVLDQGQAFTPAPLPDDIARAEPGQCYANAQRLVMRRNDLRYVEGIATSVIQMWHAWCITADGQVVDPTWDNPENRCYFGVVFDNAEAYAASVETGIFGVIPNDHIRGNPLLKYGTLNASSESRTS